MSSEQLTTNQLFDKLKFLIESSNATLRDEINDLRLDLGCKITELNEKISSLEIENMNLKTKNDLMEDNFKKNNLIIFGLDRDFKNNLENDVINFFNQQLEININQNDINECFITGKNSTTKAKPIVVKLNSFRVKNDIFKQLNKLKGSKIIVSDDYCYNTRIIRKKLNKCRIEAKELGFDSKIKYRKLKINDDYYTLEQLNSGLLKEICSKTSKKDHIKGRLRNQKN